MAMLVVSVLKDSHTKEFNSEFLTKV